MTFNSDQHVAHHSFASSHFGPKFHDDGTVTFQIWSPGQSVLSIRFAGERKSDAIAMQRDELGVFSVRTAALKGERYWVEFPDGRRRPDPASRFQPDGVHGPSQLVDTRDFVWQAADWRGLPKQSLVLYEIQLGAFTKGGTYQSAIERLDELVELGVTAIELMPLVETPGSRNWGYDGVNFYAPRNSFGTPEQLCRFVDAADQRGLAVILDVVYNHFGPEGNYLHDFGGYISPNHKTAWGDAPNFDHDGSRSMREYIVQNAVYWIEQYRFDGLRLDAIHCIEDDSKVHVVTEIGQAIDNLRRKLNREICLVAESNVYDPELLTQLSEQGHGFDAAWCDDFLHSVFAVLRPGEHMSSREYHPHSDLDIVLRRGFVFQGTLRSSRARIPLAPKTQAVRLESLIFAIQNHDFIGNHPSGLRLHQLTSHDAHRAAAALLIMHPSIPMLFMGEEFASESPFLFFADFGDQPLRKAVEEGRRREYPQHDWSHSASPLDEVVFVQSRIGQQADGNAVTLQWYKDLIRIRKEWRELGLLAAENLEAEWDEAARLARLTYRHGRAVGTVLVRLHSADEEPQVLSIESQNGLQLSANCKPDLREPGVSQVDAFGVVIQRFSMS